MSKEKTLKKFDNPILFNNAKVELLEEAYDLFSKVFDEYLDANPEKEEELSEIKVLFKSTFLEQKAAYLLEYKLELFNEYVNRAMQYALKENKERTITKSSETNLFYLKKSRFTLNN